MIPLRGTGRQQGWAWVTLGLIAANSAVFFYQLKLGEKAALALFWQGGAVPARLSHKLLLSGKSLQLLGTVFVSLFLHAGWVHLVGNMWFLWVFGEALEEDLGHWRFLGFYLFCGFFACLFHVMAASTVNAPLIGASGAIAGVMGGYLLRLPQRPILTLVFWRLKPERRFYPAFVWLGLWLLLQFYGLRQGGAIAWMAHLGGFFTGLLTVNLFTPLGKPVKVVGNPGKVSKRRKKHQGRK